MKKLLLFFIAIGLIIVSCEPENVIQINSIKLSVDKYGVFSTGNDKITFNVTSNTAEDVTQKCSIYVNNELITGNEFSSAVIDEYTVYADYNGIKSETITIGVIEKSEAPTSYTQKLLAEDYTGTWCGYCPRASYSLEEAVNSNANIIPAAIHNGDGMAFGYEAQMREKYGVSGFPTVIVNRKSSWDENHSTLNNALNKTPDLGLAISSTIDGNNLEVNVKVGFAVNFNEALKLVVYLTEDGHIEDQANYYNNDSSSPWYQKGNPIKNFEHKHVLEATLTNIFGNSIPIYQGIASNTYSEDFSFNASNLNLDKVHIVAFVLKDNSTSVFNVQTTKAGTNQDFD